MSRQRRRTRDRFAFFPIRGETPVQHEESIQETPGLENSENQEHPQSQSWAARWLHPARVGYQFGVSSYKRLSSAVPYIAYPFIKVFEAIDAVARKSREMELRRFARPELERDPLLSDIA